LKTALRNAACSLVAPPTSAQSKLPGNIGDGINSDANTNKRKNATRMTVPLIVDYLSEDILGMFRFGGLSEVSNIAIFNKSSCLPVQHEYKT
jgi:hypothetical protein